MTESHDACPCGSGQPYRACCGTAGATADRVRPALTLLDGGTDAAPLPRPPLTDLTLTDPWELALVPLAAPVDDDPLARPVVLLVLSNGVIATSDLLVRAPAEAAELAPHLEALVMEAITGSGTTPRHVHVRHAELAAALGPRLVRHGIIVTATHDLPQAREAESAVAEKFSGLPAGAPAMSRPQTWAAWGLPNALVARLFARSAALYHAAPWNSVHEARMIRAQIPGGGTWWVLLLGWLRVRFGISLYQSDADIRALQEGQHADAPFSHLEGAVITITFESRDDIWDATRREVREQQWKVAGPRGWPLLDVLNTPGGGITRRQAEDLVAVIDAMPRFVAANRAQLEREALDDPVQWRDETTGIAFELPIADVNDERPWPVPETLATAGPEGPGATPGATLHHLSIGEYADLVEQTIGRFARWMERGAKPRLSRKTAQRHAANARPFIQALVHGNDMPPEAVTELDLRDYLYRLFPQFPDTFRGKPAAQLTALRYFFAYLAQSAQVVCPWADAIVRDREALRRRCATRPTAMFTDAAMRAWVGALMADFEARVLLPTPEPGAGITWLVVGGEVETALHDEVSRLWLLWRDETIREGVVTRAALRARLRARQREWMHAPNPVARDQTPAEAIAQERAAAAADEFAAAGGNDTLRMDSHPTVLEAFRFDLARHPKLEHHPDANVWLLVGHCLQRLGYALPEDRATILGQCVKVLQPAPATDSEPSWPGHPRLAKRLERASNPAHEDAAAEVCLTLAREISQAGADWVASAILRAVRDAFPSLSASVRKRALNAQAEIAERLGFGDEAQILRIGADIPIGV